MAGGTLCPAQQAAGTSQKSSRSSTAGQQAGREEEHEHGFTRGIPGAARVSASTAGTHVLEVWVHCEGQPKRGREELQQGDKAGKRCGVRGLGCGRSGQASCPPLPAASPSSHLLRRQLAHVCAHAHTAAALQVAALLDLHACGAKDTGKDCAACGQAKGNNAPGTLRSNSPCPRECTQGTREGTHRSSSARCDPGTAPPPPSARWGPPARRSPAP